MLPVPDDHDIEDPSNPYYEIDIIERTVKIDSDKHGIDVTKQMKFYVIPADIAQEQGHGQVLDIPVAEPIPEPTGREQIPDSAEVRKSQRWLQYKQAGMDI